MVDKEIVLETIKKMYESGIDDSVVEQTLRDIGLGPEEIKQYISEAKEAGPGPKAAVRPASVVAGPAAASSMAEPKPLAARREAAEEKVDHAAMHTTTHAALEGQAAKTAELIEKISGLERKLSSSKGEMPESLASVNQRLGSMEKQLREIKAELAATKAIMEKILETDRKVLNRL